MKLKNLEFKARISDPEEKEQRLLTMKPVFKGIDNQVDTYFKIASGRLKLREGNIENALIYYERPDLKDIKQADILIYKHNPDKSLPEILERTLGIRVIVEKKRKIYFIENVKFHFDTIKNLGTFLEVEAIDETGKIPAEKLLEQCRYWFEFFGLTKADLINKSYSDMVSGQSVS
jgi:adenylate cyclase class 2